MTNCGERMVESSRCEKANSGGVDVCVWQQHAGGSTGPQCRHGAGGGQEDTAPDRTAGHLPPAQHSL